MKSSGKWTEFSLTTISNQDFVAKYAHLSESIYRYITVQNLYFIGTQGMDYLYVSPFLVIVLYTHSLYRADMPLDDFYMSVFPPYAKFQCGAYSCIVWLYYSAKLKRSRYWFFSYHVFSIITQSSSVTQQHYHSTLI